MDYGHLDYSLTSGRIAVSGYAETQEELRAFIGRLEQLVELLPSSPPTPPGEAAR